MNTNNQPEQEPKGQELRGKAIDYVEKNYCAPFNLEAARMIDCYLAGHREATTAQAGKEEEEAAFWREQSEQALRNICETRLDAITDLHERICEIKLSLLKFHEEVNSTTRDGKYWFEKDELREFITNLFNKQL